MDRPHSTLTTPTDIARVSQIEGLQRLVGRRKGSRCYEIDPSASTVRFAVSFFGLFTVEGGFSGLTGTINHHTSDLRASSCRCTVLVTSVNSGVGLRDRHLRSRDYLDVERFPTAAFESSAIEWQQDGFLVHGRLSVRGAQRAIVVHMKYPSVSAAAGEDSPVDLHGHFSVNRRHFGVLGTGERKRRFDPRDLTIGNMVDVTLRIRARPLP
jgi:polyisoprenoid-binding protein YceI